MSLEKEPRKAPAVDAEPRPAPARRAPGPTAALGNGATAAAARDRGPAPAAPPERQPWERVSGLGDQALVAVAPPSEGGGETLIMPEERVTAAAPEAPLAPQLGNGALAAAARDRVVEAAAPAPAPPAIPGALVEPPEREEERAEAERPPEPAVRSVNESETQLEATAAKPVVAEGAAPVEPTAVEAPTEAPPTAAPPAEEAPSEAAAPVEAPAAAPGGEGAGAVAAWSARVHGRIQSMPKPKITGADVHVVSLGQAGGAAEARWKKKVEDIPKEAKKVLEAQPIKPLEEIPPIPAPDPVPEATALVAAQSKHELGAQKLPDLVNTPHGFKPTIGGPPIDTTKPPPPPAPPAKKPGARSKTPVKDVNAALDKTPAPAPAPGEGQTITGSERPPVYAIAAPHRADLAKVLARVMDEASESAAGIYRDARARAYAIDLNGKATLKDLGNDLVPVETTWFREEMYRVADAAQIGRKALDDAVEARHKELEEKKDEAGKKLADESKQQQAKVQASAADARATIKSVRQQWDAHFDRVAAEAKGGVDPVAVRAEQDKLSDILRKHASEHIVAWQGMRKERFKKLDRALEDQLIAYQEAALADESARQQASVAKVTDPALLAWLKERRTGVATAVAGLKGEVQKTTDQWQTDMQTARDAAVEKVREWADKRIGRERSWLERILAKVLDAIEARHTDNGAFADAQTQETVAALGEDLQVLNDLKTKGFEGLDRDAKGYLAKQDDEQRALLSAYFEGPDKGDTVLYLARMLQLRLRRLRLPDALKSIRGKVMELDNVKYWSELEVIGRSQNPGFSAQRAADLLWQAFEHFWGTDEEKAYRAVEGLTAEQGKAVRGAYRFFHGEDLDTRLADEMSDEELDRVKYGLEGQKAQADAAAIRDAVEGAGTDEELINRVLRNKTPEERRAIAEAYRLQYGEELKARLDDELSGDDKAITDAHWDGNTEKADALEIKVAREGFWGPDHEKIEKVYTRVREEATQYGDARGWRSKDIDVEIARRTSKMAVEYKQETKRELLPDLEAAFTPPAYGDEAQRAQTEQYWAGRRDLVLGMATGDMVRADAGKIQIERTGVYAKDDTVNAVLALQYDRAYDRAKRDAMVDWQEKNPGKTPGKKDLADIEAQVVATAKAEGQRSMAALGTFFEQHYTGGKESFEETLKDLTSGIDEEKALALRRQGGKLEDAQVLDFATRGGGTDDETFKKLLKSKKTKEEVDKLEAEWQKLPGNANRTIKELIEDETSGRLKEDLLSDYTYGSEPEDPKAIVDKARRAVDYERETGGEDVYVDELGRKHVVKSHEFKVLEKRLALLEENVAEAERLKKLPETDPRRAWSAETLRAGVEGVKSAVETNRVMVDQKTEILSQVASMAVAIVVGVVLTAVTGGAATPLAIALIAGVSALAGAAAGIVVKASIKGKAYGADELGVDIALGVVDAIVSAATAGIGGKILKGATAAAKAAGAGGKGLMVTLGRMAEGNVAKRAAAHFIAEGAEGFLQSLPTAVLGTALNEQTWKEGNPFLNMLAGVGMGVGMGTFASGTIGALTNLKRAPHAPTPHALPDLGPKTGIIDIHNNPGKLADIEARYFELNPTHTKADFRHNYDGALLAMAKHDPEIKARLESKLRDEITDLLPPHHKAQLGDTPVEMWDAKRFESFTGSASGQAVVVIKDGRPTVIVKQGADPHALAQEGFHLVQAMDPKTRAKVARLDEATLARWSTMDPREKLQLYREKLDLELDAQKQLVEALEKRGAAGRDVAERLAAERATLANLEKRLGEVQRIGPLQRTLMAWGLVYEPPWLDQPARLFTKKKPVIEPPGPAAKPKPEGPEPTPEPVAPKAQPRSVDELRKEIEALRKRAAKQKTPPKQLAELEAELLAHYQPRPGETAEAAIDRLFRRDPRESLVEYRKRLLSMSDEVLAGTGHANDERVFGAYLDLIDRVEKQIAAPHEAVIAAKQALQRAEAANSQVDDLVARAEAKYRTEQKRVDRARTASREAEHRRNLGTEDRPIWESIPAWERRKLEAAEQLAQAKRSEAAARAERTLALEARGRSQSVVGRLKAELAARERAVIGVDDALYARLRDATPSKKVRDDLLARHTVDEVYGEPPAAGEKLSADHIVSVKEITNMEGFNKLTYRQQLEVLNFPENFMAMHKSVNSSKGARSWTTWDGMVSDKRFPKVKPEVRAKMIQREADIRTKLRELIARLQES